MCVYMYIELFIHIYLYNLQSNRVIWWVYAIRRPEDSACAAVMHGTGLRCLVSKRLCAGCILLRPLRVGVTAEVVCTSMSASWNLFNGRGAYPEGPVAASSLW